MTTPSDTRVTLSEIMRGTEANLLGTVHGGHLMKAVDSIAGVVANRYAGGPAVTAAMEKGDDVKLPGFGSFEVQERGERQGRNLRTGEPLVIAASKAVRFSVGSKLKAAANGKSE